VVSLIRPILVSSVGVTALTWGTLMLEYLLSAALLMPKRYWRPLLVLGVALHAGIIVLHGLLSFAIVMFGALVLYLRPMDRAFELFGRKRLYAQERPRDLAPRVSQGMAFTHE
jgi:hypothetical protein